ncbi:fimbria/pilus outer membrane usher protein [Escherichia coli]|nr:fimbria/pilus outer membrane usher protein [Escherichia coli]
MKQRRLFKLSLLALSMYSHFSVSTELNLDFIQGTSVIPSILKTDTTLPAGQYVVDVLVNNERTKRANLVITEEDETNDSLCLTPEWLDNAGVMMKKNAYDDVFDKEKQCYVLTRNPHTKVDFDYGAQTLKFKIPQAYLLSKTDPARWDYGVNGGRLKYYGNFNKTVHNDFNAFGNLDAAINLGRWVLSSNMNISRSDTRTSGTTFNSSVSAMPTDRFNYSLSANAGSKGNRGASASASYAFDAIQTNMGVSRSYSKHGNSQTSFSGSISGSVLGTAETGPLFTKESSGTVGIISIPGVKGVSVNSSMPTNSRGNTVVWLSEYSENSININMDNVPDNMEFETTSYKVVPTEGAMVYRKFGFENVLRYILRVKDAQGNYLTGGDAKTEQGLNAGFISNNGVLLMNMLAEPTSVSVDTGDGKQCRFSMAGLKANTNKVQEVRCE